MFWFIYVVTLRIVKGSSYFEVIVYKSLNGICSITNYKLLELFL